LFKACYPYSCHIILVILTIIPIKYDHQLKNANKPGHPHKDANQICPSSHPYKDVKPIKSDHPYKDINQIRPSHKNANQIKFGHPYKDVNQIQPPTQECQFGHPHKDVNQI